MLNKHEKWAGRWDSTAQLDYSVSRVDQHKNPSLNETLTLFKTQRWQYFLVGVLWRTNAWNVNRFNSFPLINFIPNHAWLSQSQSLVSHIAHQRWEYYQLSARRETNWCINCGVDEGKWNAVKEKIADVRPERTTNKCLFRGVPLSSSAQI